MFTHRRAAPPRRTLALAAAGAVLTSHRGSADADAVDGLIAVRGARVAAPTSTFADTAGDDAQALILELPAMSSSSFAEVAAAANTTTLLDDDTTRLVVGAAFTSAPAPSPRRPACCVTATAPSCCRSRRSVALSACAAVALVAAAIAAGLLLTKPAAAPSGGGAGYPQRSVLLEPLCVSHTRDVGGNRMRTSCVLAPVAGMVKVRSLSLVDPRLAVPARVRSTLARSRSCAVLLGPHR